MMEIDNDRKAVFTYLMNRKLQLKVSTFTIINEMVNHDYVVVHDAPPRAVREIVNNFVMVRLREDSGLLIPLKPGTVEETA